MAQLKESLSMLTHIFSIIVENIYIKKLRYLIHLTIIQDNHSKK